MFDPWCATCGARVLLTPRRLLTLAATADGHIAHLRCWCGTDVVQEIARVAPDPMPARPRTGATAGVLRSSPPLVPAA